MACELCDRCLIGDVCDLPDGMRPQPPKCGGFVPKESGEEADGHEQERKSLLKSMPRWIPVKERLPECDLGAEVGNIEWISNGMVHDGCFGRGGKYRDTYFRTWTDAGEGMDAKDADYWRAVTIPQPPKEERA